MIINEYKLTVIVPCYNEAESLPHLKKLWEQWLEKSSEITQAEIQLIFVDDASTDGTSEVIRKIFPQAELLHNIKNLNLGGAVKKAIPYARGKYTVVLDADGSYPPTYIDSMLRLAQGRDHFMISASAHHPDAGFAQHTPWWRVFLSKNLQRMYSLLMCKKSFSYTSIFRLYGTKSLQSITIESSDFMAMTEMMVKLMLQGNEVVEMPAVSHYRLYGVSKAKIFATIKSHLFFMGKILLWKLGVLPKL
jgi:dolichol-phosphate mannosyltransferase